MANYSETVLLPRTSFPMKADLSRREPEFLAFWKERDIYARMLSRNEGKTAYILHDGPPYANGHIHIGTALNKILKDMVVKYKLLRGYYSPYVPGWDCHGMPIEHQVLAREKADKHKVNQLEFRRKAAEYARTFAGIQKEEFVRLGILGDWEHPYLTLAPEYEARIIATFGKLALAGFIHRADKPIHWCLTCETALAEAEIEYEDDASPSIYVFFPVKAGHAGPLNGDAVSFMIWTTTPWTLPANSGIALNPRFEYALVETDTGRFVVAAQLADRVLAKTGRAGRVVKTFKGTDLEGAVCVNPLTGRDSLVVLADYVTGEDGAGCVHTAPGHGEDDYYTGLKYHLPILSPVDSRGRYTAEYPEMQGTRVFDANSVIVEKLRSSGALYFAEETTHAYPHCWRCKKPVIFRTTPQWFLKIDHQGLRGLLKGQIEKTNWVPAEGQNRIGSMVDTRPDWCLSRQRLWGVPIPYFYCTHCNQPVLTRETVAHVEQLVRRHGSDIWIEKEARDLLPAGFACPHCGKNGFRKETDILDVWFDSGVSHLAVLQERPALAWPADLYLEGSDQHRGWFQTSLITACAVAGQAPFRTVVTHGFVVDSEGRKMSKSLGNVITPDKIISAYGAEILRLWTASENYQQDIRISDGILKNLVTTYRTIRNTLRYLLGNLYDYSPEQAVDSGALAPVDRWALEKLNETVVSVTADFDQFLFYRAYEKLYDFCNIWLSSFYLDYLKDRLYTHGQNSPERKSAQTVLAAILDGLLRILAPVLSFTAEDAYRCVAWKRDESVFLESWPESREPDRELLAHWDRFFQFRKAVLKKIEEKRAEKVIGSSAGARVTVECSDEWLAFLRGFQGLTALLMVAELTLKPGGEDLEIAVEKSAYGKCERCWTHGPSVGHDTEFADLCEKCARVLKTDHA